LLITTLVVVSALIYYGGKILLTPDIHFDIYVLGGSTARGRPYPPSVDLGLLLSYYFGDRIDGRPVRVVNLARGGGTASYAYKRSRKIAGDADLVLLYSGNNEFLQFNQDRDLSEQQRLLFDTAIADRETKARVLEDYEESIEKTILRCKKKGVPVILSTVAVNTTDVAPNRSELSESVDRSRVETLLDLAREERRRGNCEQAVTHYEEIIAMDREFALA
jgi:hypothetical protein